MVDGLTPAPPVEPAPCACPFFEQEHGGEGCMCCHGRASHVGGGTGACKAGHNIETFAQKLAPWYTPHPVATRRPDAWLAGFAVALAEIHRLLLGGNNSSGVREVARNAGLTLAVAAAAGVDEFDLKELRKAGVK